MKDGKDVLEGQRMGPRLEGTATIVQRGDGRVLRVEGQLGEWLGAIGAEWVLDRQDGVCWIHYTAGYRRRLAAVSKLLRRMEQGLAEAISDEG